jgi:hypothetical protein
MINSVDKFLELVLCDTSDSTPAVNRDICKSYVYCFWRAFLLIPLSF